MRMPFFDAEAFSIRSNGSPRPPFGRPGIDAQRGQVLLSVAESEAALRSASRRPPRRRPCRRIIGWPPARRPGRAEPRLRIERQGRRHCRWRPRGTRLPAPAAAAIERGLDQGPADAPARRCDGATARVSSSASSATARARMKYDRLRFRSRTTRPNPPGYGQARPRSHRRSRASSKLAACTTRHAGRVIDRGAGEPHGAARQRGVGRAQIERPGRRKGRPGARRQQRHGGGIGRGAGDQLRLRQDALQQGAPGPTRAAGPRSRAQPAARRRSRPAGHRAPSARGHPRRPGYRPGRAAHRWRPGSNPSPASRARASSTPTPATGRSSARPSPLAKARPTRRPVNEPGPHRHADPVQGGKRASPPAPWRRLDHDRQPAPGGRGASARRGGLASTRPSAQTATEQASRQVSSASRITPAASRRSPSHSPPCAARASGGISSGIPARNGELIGDGALARAGAEYGVAVALGIEVALGSGRNGRPRSISRPMRSPCGPCTGPLSARTVPIIGSVVPGALPVPSSISSNSTPPWLTVITAMVSSSATRTVPSLTLAMGKSSRMRGASK